MGNQVTAIYLRLSIEDDGDRDESNSIAWQRFRYGETPTRTAASFTCMESCGRHAMVLYFTGERW